MSGSTPTGLSNQPATEQLLRTWFDLEAPTGRPDALAADVHRATAGVRPRPGWLARRVGHHLDGTSALPGARRQDGRWLAAVALVIVLVGSTIAIGAGA